MIAFITHECADPTLSDQVFFLAVRALFLYGALGLITGLIYRL